MRHDHRAAIQAALTPAQLAYLRQYPPHLWPPVGPQLRDFAVRDARNLVAPNLAPCPAAGRLETALARYAAATWRHVSHLETLPADAPQERLALHRVLRLNNGRLIRKRRIIEVCRFVDLHDADMNARNCTAEVRHPEHGSQNNRSTPAAPNAGELAPATWGAPA